MIDASSIQCHSHKFVLNDFVHLKNFNKGLSEHKRKEKQEKKNILSSLAFETLSLFMRLLLYNNSRN